MIKIGSKKEFDTAKNIQVKFKNKKTLFFFILIFLLIHYKLFFESCLLNFQVFLLNTFLFNSSQNYLILFQHK